MVTTCTKHCPDIVRKIRHFREFIQSLKVEISTWSGREAWLTWSKKDPNIALIWYQKVPTPETCALDYGDSVLKISELLLVLK